MLYERNIDQQGRIIIPDDLFKHTLVYAKKIAFVYKSENEAIIKREEDVSKNDMVLFIRSIDSKHRIIVPAELRATFLIFVVYAQNHELVIRGVS